MDWTDFDRDGQATLALNLVTKHGRATPLLWLTVWKEELSEQRNDFEDACLVRLKELAPPGCAVRVRGMDTAPERERDVAAGVHPKFAGQLLVAEHDDADQI